MPQYELPRNAEQKLEKILFLLEGEEDLPGLVKRVAVLEELMTGRKGNDGLVHQVRTMWRVHIWLLCSASGLLGYIVKGLIEKLIH